MGAWISVSVKNGSTTGTGRSRGASVGAHSTGPERWDAYARRVIEALARRG